MQCLWFHLCRAPLSGRFSAVIPVWGYWVLAIINHWSSWFNLSGTFMHCKVFTQPLNTLHCTGEIPDQVLRVKIHLSGKAINDSEWSLGPMWVLLISSAPCWYGHRTSWLLPFPCCHRYPAHQKGGIDVYSVIYTNCQAGKKPPGLSLWLWPWNIHYWALWWEWDPTSYREKQDKRLCRTTKSSVTICECLRLLPYSFLKSIIHSLILMDLFLWLPSCWPAETQW